MSQAQTAPAFLDALRTLFTRTYVSAADYVFQSQPFAHADDEALLAHVRGIQTEERRHARWLAQVHEAIDEVAEPGAFPYWYRDLNYLTASYMGAFLIETIETDLALYDQALALVPEALGLARTMLAAIRSEKVDALAALRPLVAEAREREAARYAAGTAAAKEEREARLAKEKAATAALRAAKAPKPKPTRAAPAPAPAAAPTQTFEAYMAANGVLDPDEDGLDNKEKGKRKVLLGRARKKWGQGQAPAAPAALADAPAAAPSETFEAYMAANGVLDPDEDGLDNKEKGKRKVLLGRARKKWERAQAETTPAALADAPAAAPSETFEAYKAANGVLDPDEPGLDNKERGKRKVLLGRARKKWERAQAETAPVAPPTSAAVPSEIFEAYMAANGVLDPDEPGLDNKERGKRKVLLGRARKKWEQARGDA